MSDRTPPLYKIALDFGDGDGASFLLARVPCIGEMICLSPGAQTDTGTPIQGIEFEATKIWHLASDDDGVVAVVEVSRIV